ncbi:MAG: hypothetical protein KC656_25445, partial [Myxococcales bacterium]|nr:hypothetical protein [Myxococcales bacterium]
MRALLVVALLAGCRNDTGFTNLVGGDGVLRFNLQFDNEALVDLDLHVLTPADEEIWYAEPVDSSGGSLDVDCYCGSCEQGGNENVFWDYTGARPPAG